MNIFIKNKNFRKFSLASMLSSAGDILFYLALMTYASKLKNYSLALSLIAISESIPKILDSVGGYLADRTKNKFKNLVLFAVIRFLLYLTVGILFAQNINGWNLVMIVIVINFISDLIGSYSGGLQTPVIVNIVGVDEVAEANGFTGGVNQIISMIAQFVGSGLLLFMSYSSLAIVNAFTFLAAGMLFGLVGLQTKKDIAITEQPTINQQGYFSTMLDAFKQVKKAKGLMTTVLTLALLNGILGSIEPLISIVTAGSRKTMIVFNYSFTIALIGATLACGMALGSIVGPQVFKKTSLIMLSVVASVICIITAIVVLLKNIFFIMPVLFVLGVTVGTINPKLTQWLVTTVDRTILSSSIGLLNTILLIITPIMTTIFTTISGIFNINYALYAVLFTACIILLITLNLLRQKKEAI
ncbi:MFS transporter [Xylocopilactobacillus apis]|uniref:MFS transporter n=1 Tax=Xylocopilactobacillus apis TaxID=2932183 RepID=A0AAU9DBK4_9LACO|nr:MFS transporter [Xylocopilactobacillus apis]BDR57150.1 MFS transporter [Xylocopilactobacillus apis]